VILLGLYLILTPRATKISSENLSPQFQQEEIRAVNQSSAFRGPTGSPSVKGPGSQPPQE